MKRAYFGLVLVLIFLAFSVSAQAFSFTDSEADDFYDHGAFFQTEQEGDTIILGNETSEYYYSDGSYTRSDPWDAGRIVNWTTLSWVADVSENQSLEIGVKTSSVKDDYGECISWSTWYYYNESPATLDVEPGYCMQYRVSMETQNNTTTPVFDEMTVDYENILPTVSLDSPPDDFVSDSGNITFECSASSPNNIFNITLYYDAGGTWHANETKMGSDVVFERTNLTNGVIEWNCLAFDNADQSAFAPENRSVIVGVVDEDPPEITHSITPGTVQVNGTVEINISATDDTGVDLVWYVITKPDLTTESGRFIEGVSVSYTFTADQMGTYNIDIYANDTLGNQDSVSDSFTVTEGPANITNMTVNMSAIDFNNTPVDFTLTFYQNMSEVDSFSSVNGSVTGTIPGGTYDAEFDSWDSDLVVTLKDLDITSDMNETLGLDKPNIPPSGYVLSYSVISPFGSAADVQLGYPDALFEDESGIAVYMCTNWDFQNQSCSGTWSLENSTQDTSANTLTVFLDNLVSYGFSIKQEAFCGDDVCGPGETPENCPDDCECEDGETQTCGTSDIPPCSLGTQTCSDGEWGPCVGAVEPTDEVCNQVDDDCDGVIDNILGGTTPEDSGCQCVGGAEPLPNETCNNIDDDCDGQIDEGLQRQCGTEAGICEYGLSTCTGGAWGECIGGVEARSEEICGNDLDDDCDGRIDEDCIPIAQPAPQPSGLPWNIIFIVIAVVLVGLVGFILYKRFMKPGGKDKWKELEERYGGAGAAPGAPEEKPTTSWDELEKKYKKEE